MSKPTTNKYLQAIHIAHNVDIGLAPRSKPGLMSPTTLYTLLRRAGWNWDANVQEWHLKESKPSQNVVLGAGLQGHAEASVSDLAMLRIMAHVSILPKITAKLREFCEVFDIEVLSVSEPVNNYGEEQFKRIYFRIRVKS